MEEVFELLKKIGTYYLATVDGNKPRVRPFGTVDLYNGKLYIQTGKKKDVSKQIEKNPNVELCAFQSICLITTLTFETCIMRMMTTPWFYILRMVLLQFIASLHSLR